MQKHCADVLRAQIKAKFPPRTPQVAIAKAIGIPQGVLSKLLAEKGSLGANTLLALRRFTGLTIDELLGLDPQPHAMSRDELEALLAGLVDRVRRPKP